MVEEAALEASPGVARQAAAAMDKRHRTMRPKRSKGGVAPGRKSSGDEDIARSRGSLKDARLKLHKQPHRHQGTRPVPWENGEKSSPPGRGTKRNTSTLRTRYTRPSLVTSTNTSGQEERNGTGARAETHPLFRMNDQGKAYREEALKGTAGPTELPQDIREP